MMTEGFLIGEQKKLIASYDNRILLRTKKTAQLCFNPVYLLEVKKAARSGGLYIMALLERRTT